jgi:hypothetical protein
MADPRIAVRASDADRERVVEILRRGHVDGRLTLAELEERSATAYSARTCAELAPLTADLPAPPAERAARVREGPSYAGPSYVVFAALLGAWVVAIAVFGVFIPPLPLLLFLVLRMTMVRRRHHRVTEHATGLRSGTA